MAVNIALYISFMIFDFFIYPLNQGAIQPVLVMDYPLLGAPLLYFFSKHFFLLKKGIYWAYVFLLDLARPGGRGERGDREAPGPGRV